MGREYDGIHRISFLIGKDGKVASRLRQNQNQRSPRGPFWPLCNLSELGAGLLDLVLGAGFHAQNWEQASESGIGDVRDAVNPSMGLIFGIHASYTLSSPMPRLSRLLTLPNLACLPC